MTLGRALRCSDIARDATPAVAAWRRQPAGGKWLWAVCIAIAPNVLWADAYVLTPSVSLESRYDDNYRLAPDGEPQDKVGIARIVGDLQLSRITETVELSGLLRVDGATFFGDDEDLDDNTNQLLDLTALRKSELTRYGLNGEVRRDSFRRNVDVVEDPEDVTIDENASVDEDLIEQGVRQNVRRNRIIVQPFLQRQLTELTSARVSYRYSTVFYGDTQGAVQLNEFTDHTVASELATRITQRDRFVFSPVARLFRGDNGRQFNTYEAQVGVGHEFSETTSATFTAGGRYTTFDLPGVDGDDVGFVARLRGRKRTGLTRFEGVIERTVSPSGSGNQVQTSQLQVNVRRKLTERLDFSLRSRLYQNESIQDEASRSDRRFFQIEPRLTYQLARDWGLELGYRYREQKRFFQTDSGKSNSVLLSLNYSRPTPIRQTRTGQSSTGSVGR